MMTLNCPEYLKQAERYLQREEERATHFLQPETKHKLLEEVRIQLVDSQAANLVELSSGCNQMFKGSKLDELALLFRVFKRNEKLNFPYVIQKMAPYI